MIFKDITIQSFASSLSRFYASAYHAMKTYGEWRYSSTHFWHKTELSASVGLLPGDSSLWPLDTRLGRSQSRYWRGSEEKMPFLGQ
jgi:hypothetical protein